MQIHTVKCGETVKDIAVEYGVSEDNIRANNGIPEGEVTEGEQLMLGGNDSYVAMCHRCWKKRIAAEKNN